MASGKRKFKRVCQGARSILIQSNIAGSLARFVRTEARLEVTDTADFGLIY